MNISSILQNAIKTNTLFKGTLVLNKIKYPWFLINKGGSYSVIIIEANKKADQLINHIGRAGGLILCDAYNQGFQGNADQVSFFSQVHAMNIEDGVEKFLLTQYKFYYFRSTDDGKGGPIQVFNYSCDIKKREIIIDSDSYWKSLFLLGA